MKKHPKLNLAIASLVVLGAALVIAQTNRPAVTNGACCASFTNPALLSSMAAVATNAPAVALEKKGLPKLLDLGAGKCIPCKMMAPILEEMKKEYAGTLEVEFIDVWKNPDAGKQYQIEVIPTQIFYDTTVQINIQLIRFINFTSIGFDQR